MRQHLIFDADDTLWENNIYFERAFDEFVGVLDHSSMTAEQVRAVLDEIELVNREVHGYGALNFGRNLRQCYQRLCQRAILPADLERVMALAERILEQPVELLEGVEATLCELATRHDVLLFTKGHPEEQKLKIERSGLGRHFCHVEIAREKNPDSFGRLLSGRALDPARAWMIGNSPRSDINPALELGLGAVYIPHAQTWSLEKEEIRRNGGRLLVLKRFSELCRHF